MRVRRCVYQSVFSQRFSENALEAQRLAYLILIYISAHPCLLCFCIVAGLHRAVSGILPAAFACAATSGTEAAAAGTIPADAARGRSPAARGPAHCQAQPHRSLPYQVS